MWEYLDISQMKKMLKQILLKNNFRTKKKRKESSGIVSYDGKYRVS